MFPFFADWFLLSLSSAGSTPGYDDAEVLRRLDEIISSLSPAQDFCFSLGDVFGIFSFCLVAGFAVALFFYVVGISFSVVRGVLGALFGRG